MVYSGGDVYDGYWKNDKRNGKGILISKLGTYFGEWKDDAKHGKGQFYSSKNKDVYDGTYKEGERDGEILFYDNRTDKTYKTYW
jgi:hypothetical protein